MGITPKDLAKQLGVSDRTVRAHLRAVYRPSGQNRYARWVIDDAMAAVILQRVRGH